MSVSSPFIKRPVGTSLLTLGVLLAGILAFQFLPVAPLPQVDVCRTIRSPWVTAPSPRLRRVVVSAYPEARCTKVGCVAATGLIVLDLADDGPVPCLLVALTLKV